MREEHIEMLGYEYSDFVTRVLKPKVGPRAPYFGEMSWLIHEEQTGRHIRILGTYAKGLDLVRKKLLKAYDKILSTSHIPEALHDEAFYARSKTLKAMSGQEMVRLLRPVDTAFIAFDRSRERWGGRLML